MQKLMQARRIAADDGGDEETGGLVRGWGGKRSVEQDPSNDSQVRSRNWLQMFNVCK